MKKACKTIAKIILGILGSILGFAALCCAVTLAWAGVQVSRGEITQEMPVTPDSFVPAVRIVAFTDTHNENENVAAAVQKAYTLFDSDSTYKGVDAFFGLGDFTSIGTLPDYEAYAKVLQENVREDTVCINVLGNHEMKNADYRQLFTDTFGHDINTVTQLNGFTCIAFSGERFLTEWTVTPASLRWLDDEIQKAYETAGDKPIFVFQHPHPFGTVYGSTVWCNPQLNPVFAGNSKIVSFSGHSHFPMNDPRSINQSTYTSVGIGAMARFELDKNYIVGQHPAGYEDAAQMCVIEADEKGSVRIRGYDLLSDSFFCDYFIENVNDPDGFAYTYKNRKAHDAPPCFPEDGEVFADRNEDGSYTLHYTHAQPADGFVVHTYEVCIRDESGKKLFEDSLLSDYYIIDNDDTFSFTVPPQILPQEGSCTLHLIAKSAYHKKSEPVTLSFDV